MVSPFKEGAKFSCGQCWKQYTKQVNLARHIRAAHEGVKFHCGQCGNKVDNEKQRFETEF